ACAQRAVDPAGCVRPARPRDRSPRRRARGHDDPRGLDAAGRRRRAARGSLRPRGDDRAVSLLEEQYRDDSNLRARIDLHARYSTNPEGWFEWLWAREAPSSGARVLEVGCGPAEMWRVVLDRLDPTVSLTLSDFSPGMIEA